MEGLKTAVSLLSCFALIGGCLLMLIPNGGLRQGFQFLLSLSVVLLILTAFSVKVEFDLPEFSFDESALSGTMAESVQRQYIRSAEDAAKALITETLKEEKITPAEIQVVGDISADGSISMDYIEVLLHQADAAKLDGVYQLLKREIGGQITVKLQEVERYEP